MRSVWSRRSEASTTSRMCCGRLSSPSLSPSSMRNPNFVAMTTLVAPALQRAPEQLLVAERPVTSAVSKKVTPSSSARWMVATDSASSLRRRTGSSPCSRARGPTPPAPAAPASASPASCDRVPRTSPLSVVGLPPRPHPSQRAGLVGATRPLRNAGPSRATSARPNSARWSAPLARAPPPRSETP